MRQSRLLFAAAVCVAVGAGFTAGAPARADSSTVSVGDAAEAWYQSAPVDPCSSPVGCPPAPPVTPPSPYPANTLNVGAAAGTQGAAAYVEPDLSAVPAGEQPVSGTMTLPLATVSGNGNLNTASAAIVACLVTGSINDGTAGATTTPPTSDCMVKSQVKSGTDAFTLDLAPFLAAWNNGKQAYGIALLPDPSASPASAWQVAFNGRNLQGASHITSALTLGATGDQSGSGAGGLGFGDSASGSTADQSGLAGPSPTEIAAAPSPLSIVPAPLAAAPSPSPAFASPVASGPVSPVATPATHPLLVRAGGFRYPEVMLLPLVFAAGLIFAIRLLVSDATPKRKSA